QAAQTDSAIQRRNPWIKPIAAQPIGHEADRLRIENFFVSKGRHAIVALPIKARVTRIANDRDEPFARTIPRQIGARRILILRVELMTIGAYPAAFQQIAPLGNYVALF